MSLAWDAVAVLSGMVLWALVPLVGGGTLDVEGRRKLHDHYAKLAYTAAGRASFLGRKHGGVSLLKTAFDPEKQAEKVSIDGKTGHIEDTHNFVGRVMHRPVALAHEEGNTVLDPRICELGKAAKQQIENAGHVRTFDQDADGDKQPKPRFCPYFTIPDTDTFVNLRDGLWILPGSADPFLSVTADELVQRSQARFKDLNVIEIMAGIIAMGIAMGLVVVVYRFGGGQGAGPDIIDTVRVPLGFVWGWWP